MGLSLPSWCLFLLPGGDFVCSLKTLLITLFIVTRVIFETLALPHSGSRDLRIRSSGSGQA